jgi:hypothetical protein
MGSITSYTASFATKFIFPVASSSCNLVPKQQPELLPLTIFQPF